VSDPTTTLIQQVISLQERRYPTALVVLDGGIPSIDDLKVVAQACALQCIDYREDVLAGPDSNVVLGAYTRASFRDWLIATWEEHDRKAFYIDFLHIESNSVDDRSRKAPVVLLSRLAESFALPTRDRGQGIVTRAFTQTVQGAM
jgi:hypothetical protein